MTKSKRLKMTIVFLCLNFIIFFYGIYKGSDLTSLGTGLSLINVPLYGWLLSETWRPSSLPPEGHGRRGGGRRNDEFRNYQDEIG